jgi:Tol biopolymer transport system component
MLETSRSLRLAAAAAVLVLAFIAGCADDTSGPAGFRTGQLAIAPDFGVLQPDIIAIARGRFVVTRIPGGAVAADTLIDIAPDADSVALGILVPVFNPGETFNLTIRLIDTAGDTVFAGGPIEVSPTTSSTPVPIEVPFTYVGTGADAAWVEILSPDTSLFSGETVLLTAMAFDSSEAAIPGTPIGWASLDTAHVRVVTDAQYRAVATGGSQRGTAPIVATLVTGQQDTVFVGNQPLPATLVAESGSGQSGPASGTLPQPLVARVTAADGLGVRGLWVRFVVTAGGGTVSPDSALTDSTGRAQTSWSLGEAAGDQTVTASTARLAGTTITFSATAVSAQPGIASWLNPDGGAWSAGSNWTTGVPPTADDTVLIALDGTYTVTLDVPATIGALVLGGAGGEQTLDVGAGTLTVLDSATVRPTGVLVVTGGTVRAGAGQAPLLVLGGFRWNGGRMDGLRTTVRGTALLQGGDLLLSGGWLDNFGLLRWTGGRLEVLGSLANGVGGIFEIEGDQVLAAPDGEGVLVNSGTIRRTTGAGATQFDLQVISETGRLEVLTGSLALTRSASLGDSVILGAGTVLGLDRYTWLGNGLVVQPLAIPMPVVRMGGWVRSTGTVTILANVTQADSLTVESGRLVLNGGSPNPLDGLLRILAGAEIEFLGASRVYTLGAESRLEGPGTVRVRGAQLSVGGAYDVGRTQVFTYATTGQLTLATGDTARSAHALVDSIAYIDGTGVFQVSDTLVFGNGDIRGSAAVTRVAPGGTLLLGEGTVGAVSNGGTLRNAGTMVAPPGSGLLIRSLGRFVNEPTGVVDLQGDGHYFTGDAQIDNEGVWRKSSGTDTSQIALITSAAFINAGSLDVRSGVLSIRCTLWHQAGAVIQGAGTLELGSVASFAGDVRPGTSPGLLTIAGDMPQAESSTLHIELGGPAVGTQYDRLTVTGTATLGGALTVSLINGFTPAAGQEFTVLTSGARSSAFEAVSLPALPPPLVWTTSASEVDFTLSVVDTSSNIIAWINAAGGAWGTAANWSRNRVPLPTDSVVIDLAGTYTVRISGDVTAANLRVGGAGSDPTLRISTNSGTAALTVADGLTNAGAIVLHDDASNASASLTVTAGTLVNTGLIEAAGNWGGGTRTITATVDNQGTVYTYNMPLTILNTGRTFTTTAGTLNTGSYAQVLTVAGGTVLFGSGTQLTGGGTVTLPTGTALQLATDFTFGAGSATLNLAGENAGITVSGPGALIVANPTRPLVLGTDTVTAPLSIQDTLKVRAPSVATGTVDISGTGVLYLRATVLADLTVADGLTNAGTIVLHDEAGNASASLTLTAGTLVNTGLIEAAGAWGGGTRTLTATVDNQGTISTNNMPLTVVNTGRTFTTTAGTLNTGSYAQLLTIAGGTVLFGSGTQLSGNGTVTLPVGTALQLATDFTFGAGSARLDLAGENAGITVSGPGALIVANPTRPLVLGTDTITAPLSIQDTLKVRAPSVVTGTVDISGTGVLYLRSTVLAALTVADGLTNAGTIVLHDEAGNASASLTLTAGTLVSTGLIQTAANWGGGTRTITGNVDLRGTLTIGFPLNIVGQLISPAGAAATVNGNGSTLPVTGLDVDGITFNNTPLASTGGTIIRFDNVTFQNMNAGAVQFTVNHPGAATPFVFTGVRFLTTPTTGRYVRADDTDTGDGNVLTLDFVGATPPDGSAFEEELNGAVINWTVLAGINDWLPGSGVWSDPGKWSLGRVPIPGDTVRITAGGDYTVTMDVSATVARLLLGGTTDIVALNAAGYGLTVTDPGPALEILPFGYLQLAETGLVADQITNEGTIIAGDALIESALITNVGTLDVQYGPVTVYHATAGDLRTSGTLVVQNDAMLTLSTGGSLTYLGGEIAGASGTGVIRLLSNVPLVLGADLTVNNLIIESADGAVLPETGQLLTIGQYATFRAIGSGTTVILASVAVDGIIDIQSGTVVLGGTAALNSQGILRGVGALDVTGLTGTGALTGSIRPGDRPGAPAGILTWIGDFAPDPGAELAIDLGGYQAGTQHDRFDVVGGAELDGILRVTLQNGFVPEPGTRIPIMTFAAAAFGFAQLAFPDLGTLQLDTLTVDGGANPDTLYLVTSIVSQPIVFAGDSAGGLSTGLFRVEPSGTALTRLFAFTPIFEVYPRWAPDRGRIVFTFPIEGAGTENALRAISADGASFATVASDTSMRRPRFSPDGRHLAFECGDGSYDFSFGPQDVCVLVDVPADVPSMSSIGNGLGKYLTDAISSTLGGSGAFAWNPQNPSQLAVVRDPQWVVGGPFTSEIWLINADGTGAQSLTGPITWNDGPIRIGSMDWAPGGGFIAFEAVNAQSERAIYRVEVANGSITQLTQSAAAAVDDWRPVVSPDASEILFARAGDGYSLYRIPSGTPNAEVRVTPLFNLDPSRGRWDWSPDGAEIVHETGYLEDGTSTGDVMIATIPRGTNDDTYIANLRIVGRKRGTGAYVEDRQPSWRP